MKRFIASLSVFAMFIQLVPLNVAEAANQDQLFGFKLGQNINAVYVGDQQSGAGAFASGNLANGNSGVYSEGMCVPLIIRLENTDATDWHAFPSATFDHYNSGVIGYSGMEVVTGTNLNAADNLDDFTFTGADFTTLTSVTSVNGAVVNMTVTGPWAPGEGAGLMTPTSATGRYLIDIIVPANDAVNIPTCARLSDVAGAYSNGSDLQVRLGGGETVSIRPSSLLELPEMHVTKVVDNGIGGTAVASDFTMEIRDASGAVVASFPGSETATVVPLQAGTYTVGEVANGDYTMSTSGSCTGVVMALGDVAQVASCTVTNTYNVAPADNDATVTIVKVLENAPAGVEQNDFTFSFTRNGALYENNFFLNSPDAADMDNEVAGTVYTIFEDPIPAGYTVTYSPECNGTIVGGQDVTCTVTNTYNPATIIINKVLPNDDGGTEQISDFAFYIDSVEVVEGEMTQVAPGTYTIAEEWVDIHLGETIADRYDVSYSSNCLNGEITVAAGEVATCTITNDDREVAAVSTTLTVIVDVTNDDGGTATAANLSYALLNESEPQINATGVAAPGTPYSVVPGTFSVVITGIPAGYTYTGFDGRCSSSAGLIVAGDALTCTIYIDDDAQFAPLTIVKEIENTTDFDFTDFSYNLTVDGGLVASDSGFDAVTGMDVVDVAIGSTFVVAENDPGADWNVTTEGCDGTMDADGATCTITNTYDPELPPACVPGQLVVDGGFETPEVTSSDLWELFAHGTPGLSWGVTQADGGTGLNTIEFQENYQGWLADEGDQYAELDAEWPMAISQTIPTLDGVAYDISFAFSARPGTTPENNSVEVYMDTDLVTSITAAVSPSSNTSWTTYTISDYVATADNMTLTFVDNGATEDSLGTFIDDVSVRCDDFVPPTPNVLTVIVDVTNDQGGELEADDLTATVFNDNGDQVVIGSETGIDVTVTGIYDVLLDSSPIGYTVDYDGACFNTTTDSGDQTCRILVNDTGVFTITNEIVPLLECVEDIGGGQSIAHFGYANFNAGDAFIQAGDMENRFNGGGSTDEDRGQPSLFAAGQVNDAFEVQFETSIPLTWTIVTTDTNAVTAESSSPDCDGQIDSSLAFNVVVNGAANDPASFALTLNGDGSTTYTHGDVVALAPGDYTVTAAAAENFSVAFADDCVESSTLNSAGNIATDEDATCTIIYSFVNNSGSGGSGGGSNGGGSNGGGSTPPGDVLGDSDEVDEDTDDADEGSTDEPVTPPTPIVEGETDELPRTGLPVAGVLALGSVLAFLARRKED